LSATILVANSASSAIYKLRRQLEQDLKQGARRIDGWEGECDELVDESIGVADVAETFAIGAAIVTAVAAVEALLQDLVQGSTLKRKGLDGLVEGFLLERDAPPISRREYWR